MTREEFYIELSDRLCEKFIGFSDYKIFGTIVSVKIEQITNRLIGIDLYSDNKDICYTFYLSNKFDINVFNRCESEPNKIDMMIIETIRLICEKNNIRCIYTTNGILAIEFPKQV